MVMPQSALTRFIAGLGVLIALLGLAPAANACSRVTWLWPGRHGHHRSFHGLAVPSTPHLYAMPAGSTRDGAGGVNSLTWTRKYGAIEVAGTTDPNGPIDGVFDGMNTAGLVANLLYLGESDFGPAPADDRPRLSFAAWVDYVLTSFATVNEVVDAFTDPAIYLVPINFGPGGAAKPTVHLSVSDASGDSAIIEYLDGKPVIHHGRQYQVMTNSPTYDQQLTLNARWENVDRNKDLPGRFSPPTGSYAPPTIWSKLPQTTNERQAVAGYSASCATYRSRGAWETRSIRTSPHLLALGGRLDHEDLLLRIRAESRHRLGQSEQDQPRPRVGYPGGGRGGQLLDHRQHRQRARACGSIAYLAPPA